MIQISELENQLLGVSQHTSSAEERQEWFPLDKLGLVGCVDPFHDLVEGLLLWVNWLSDDVV